MNLPFLLHRRAKRLSPLLSPLLLFPVTLMLPAALSTGWHRRAEPAIRRAVAFMQIIDSDHVTFSSTDAAVRASRR